MDLHRLKGQVTYLCIKCREGNSEQKGTRKRPLSIETEFCMGFYFLLLGVKKTYWSSPSSPPVLIKITRREIMIGVRNKQLETNSRPFNFTKLGMRQIA